MSDLDLIRAVEAELAGIESELKETEARAGILRVEKNSTQVFLRRLRDRQTRRAAGRVDFAFVANAVGSGFAPAAEQPSAVKQTARDETIEKLLVDIARPVTVTELHDLANAHTGTDWDQSQIRSALASLNRKGLVTNVKRGVWASAKTSAESAGTDSAEIVPTTRPEGGTQGVEPPTPVVREDHSPVGGREADDPDRETGDRYVVSA